MRDQDADHSPVEVDDAILAARGLGLAEHSAAVDAATVGAQRLGSDLDDLLPHDESAALEVHVGPAQAKHFTAARARRSDHLEEGAEVVAGDVVEERPQLGRLPRLDLRPRCRGQLEVARRVV